MGADEQRMSRLQHQLMFFLMITRKYLINLTYVTFYIAYCERENPMPDKKEYFAQRRDKLFKLCRILDGHFSQTMEECDVSKIKKFVSREMLCELYACSEELTTELKKIVPGNRGLEDQPGSKSVQELGLLRAPTHLTNCILGFAHLYQFVRKLPLQQQYQVTGVQMDVLVRDLEQDLLPNWKNQVDSLKRHIGILMLVDNSFLQKFESSRAIASQDSTKGSKQTLSYDGWLRSQIGEQELELRGL